MTINALNFNFLRSKFRLFGKSEQVRFYVVDTIGYSIDFFDAVSNKSFEGIAEDTIQIIIDTAIEAKPGRGIPIAGMYFNILNIPEVFNNAKVKEERLVPE